jgi:Type II secretion system (T2SS), protein G
MKFAYFLIGGLLFASCGGKKISVDHAKEVIIDLPQEVLVKEDVEVTKVSQVGGTEAIVETRLKTAFRLEKVHGEWIVREVRIGHGQWEKVSTLLQTLDATKSGETRKMLERIAEAILKYRETNGNMPVFRSYVELSDALSPEYLTPLIRLDAWRRPLEAISPDKKTIELISAGSDGKFGSSDDIRLTIPQK